MSHFIEISSKSQLHWVSNLATAPLVHLQRLDDLPPVVADVHPSHRDDGVHRNLFETVQESILLTHEELIEKVSF